jgi:uncharacterized RDD family membrane protein YckC
MPGGYAARVTYTSWIRRAGSFLIDHAILIPLPILGAAVGSAAAITVCMAVNLAIYVANRWVIAGRTGRSLGRRLLGIRLVDAGDGSVVGIVRASARDVCHMIDWLLIGIGWLRPLWQRSRQTFADSITATAVVPA